MEPRPISSPAATSPLAACSAPCQALAENGLFRHIHDCLVQLRGYYSTLHVIVLLAYMALCRIKAVEQLQYQPPGEFGKLMGLDRIPEVRCLRHKLAALSLDDGPKMGRVLSRDWLEAAPELAGAVRRRACAPLSRQPDRAAQTLCLAAAAVSAGHDRLLGQRRSGPAVLCRRRPIDHGLLEALRRDIVPRLLKEVPGQPTAEQLKADRYRHAS